jgi:hypothetical protein
MFPDVGLPTGLVWFLLLPAMLKLSAFFFLQILSYSNIGGVVFEMEKKKIVVLIYFVE